MSTFTAVALDRLIESRTAMAPARNSSDSKLERRHNTPNSSLERGIDAPGSKLEWGVSVPPNPKLLEKGVGVSPNVKGVREGCKHDSKLDRRNHDSTTAAAEKTHYWTEKSPALYTTPASTPLPDSPTSFPPSPYIINHKRRGPRLMKSFSEDDVAMCERSSHENGNVAGREMEAVVNDNNSVSVHLVDCNRDNKLVSTAAGDFNEKCGSCVVANGSAAHNGVRKCASFNFQQDGDIDDFLDPQESMSVQNNSESESNGGAGRALNSSTPNAEFYDAWEELSSESGSQPAVKDIEHELRETRLSLLVEIEKRKQAEETLTNVRNEWQRIRERLSPMGLTLPVDPTTLPEGEQLADPAAELCQQVYLARFVSNLIGRGIARAEIEMEMQSQINLKNFEIARLSDRLQYYEAVNQEMSQRNQETMETARRVRQKTKRRQKWVWGSVAAAITLGSAVIGWSYFQTNKGSSSIQSHAHGIDCEPK